jgi:hypothetical protein
MGELFLQLFKPALFLPLSEPVRMTLEGSKHATTDVAALDPHQSTVWDLGEVTRFLVSFHEEGLVVKLALGCIFERFPRRTLGQSAGSLAGRTAAIRLPQSYV